MHTQTNGIGPDTPITLNSIDDIRKSLGVFGDPRWILVDPNGRCYVGSLREMASKILMDISVDELLGKSGT